ncbi:MAG: D-alanine--poly(phosphoribitol) ligase subunit DltC [Atopobiaceae bacterium]|jgi:D-alanine--poly(phosphoribitol) ligase subunit 2|nr:D-alanine--poly(phosphoribitol) ligase subunit DltC [Atopobiaceae bacterium]MCI2173077.1 D-alanine--poly(phosphoribitol) ligase subunit DltC [Atopobiaceae bacterium]MCI2208170.1 D-alanine--poly(phosphoribitol) ligase subunit DltC [Atopobiaceae bacterium]
MADKADVEARLLDEIADICGDDIVREKRDVDLFEEGLLDSMGAIELLVAIEEDFGVSIAPTAVPRDEMNTVDKICAQVLKRL